MHDSAMCLMTANEDTFLTLCNPLRPLAPLKLEKSSLQSVSCYLGAREIIFYWQVTVGLS